MIWYIYIRYIYIRYIHIYICKYLIYIYSCIAFDIVIDLPRVTRGGPILVGPHPMLPKEVPYRSFEQSSRGLMMLIAHIIYNITNMVSYMPPIGSTCSHCLDIYIIYMCFCFPLRCFFPGVWRCQKNDIQHGFHWPSLTHVGLLRWLLYHSGAYPIDTPVICLRMYSNIFYHITY
jgi:hypothetical protein